MRNVLLTGASRGIGAHLLAAFLREGYAVTAVARDMKRLVVGVRPHLEAGRPVFAAPCDVTDADAVAAVVDQAERALGPITAVVNNAGVIEDEAPLWAADLAQLRRVVEVNTIGPMTVNATVARRWVARGQGGHLVTTSSGLAAYGIGGFPAYGASKAAAARVNESVALDGAEHGIRTLDVQPGVVRTEMSTSMAMHEGRTEWNDPEETAQLVLGFLAGEYDALSGRMVRAGTDTRDSLRALGRRELQLGDRMLRLQRYGDADPAPRR